jgi:hypothetical protein
VFAADLPRITYSKSFPGSTPAYVAIIIDKSGRAEYREAPDDNDPLLFQLAEKEAGEIFGLAEKLGRFTRPLEANLKVANTGLKTFRYESGQEKQEVKFNYSMDPDARLLWDWFERITESEQHFINLQRAARYDKLGVHKALLLLEASRDRNRLVAAQQFLPLLDRIVKNESYLHMARVRAANLADSFRASPGTGQ